MQRVFQWPAEVFLIDPTNNQWRHTNKTNDALKTKPISVQ